MGREQVQGLGVAVEEDRPVAPDRLQDPIDVRVRDLERGDEDPAAQHRVELLLQDLEAAHTDRLVPEPHLAVAEAVAGHLEAAKGRRPADLQLMAVGVEHERLAGGAAGRDAQDAALVVVVREQPVVEVRPHRVLVEEGQPAEIVERRDVGRLDAGTVEQLAVEGHVVVRLVDERAELALLQLAELGRPEPLAPAELVVVPARAPADLPLVRRHGGTEEAEQRAAPRLDARRRLVDAHLAHELPDRVLPLGVHPELDERLGEIRQHPEHHADRNGGHERRAGQALVEERLDLAHRVAAVVGRDADEGLVVPVAEAVAEHVLEGLLLGEDEARFVVRRPDAEEHVQEHVQAAAEHVARVAPRASVLRAPCTRSTREKSSSW
jgi:hypothetical protein